ncbi:hypothetical protein CLCR_06857 [Cladophialophora carrionii]|uniref:Protein kinase domain-containing protein n=1 Tax=Cladophialophora carrionii TaxID=86049 RepID=A0A1C1CP82_9EURO|nr:hypothetical protein CLCR_06857 [Cladophialophora carrionii]
MDILGTIDASISLARTIRDLVRTYEEAPGAASKLQFFDVQLGVIRLTLLRSALEKNPPKLQPNKNELLRALSTLDKKLRETSTDLEALDLSRLTTRFWWTMSAGTRVTNDFADIHRCIDDLQDIVQLVHLVPKIEPLNSHDGENFSIVDFGAIKRLKNSNFGYCAEAYWKASGALEVKRETVPVFVESFRKLDNGGELVVGVAQRLWWSCDGRNNTPYQMGVLPCIGFDKHRVIFLLPKNATDPQTLRELIRGQEGKGGRQGVSLETKFSLALQLAEAVLKIHMAAVVHSSIRSDTILFLAPDATRGTPELAATKGTERSENQVAAAGISPPNRVGTGLERLDTGLKRVRTGLKRIASGLTQKETLVQDPKAGAGDAQPTDREDATKAQKVPKRKDSQRSMRKGTIRRKTTRKHFGVFKSGQGSSSEGLSDDRKVENSAAENKDAATEYDDGTTPVVGAVPPGFGSLYLISWISIRHRGEFLPGFAKAWTRNLYRHPKVQQGSVQGNMGHDIYSMGVCLLEIGLWKSFVEVENNHYVPSQLAEKAGVSIDKGKNDATQIKTKLVEIAEEDLPAIMGDGYTRLVVACLTCLDGDGDPKPPVPTWKHSFTTLDRQKDVEAFQSVVLGVLSKINDGFTG